MQTVCTENRQKFDVLVLHKQFGVESVCAIRGSLHTVVLEGKMSLRGSVIDTYFKGGVSCATLLCVLGDKQLIEFLSIYMSSRRLG